MKKERMTIEELISLKPSMENPVELELDDDVSTSSRQKIKIIIVHNDRFGYIDNKNNLFTGDDMMLKYYPSKKASKWETVWECHHGLYSAKKFENGDLLATVNGKMERQKAHGDYPLIEGGGVWEVNLETNEIRVKNE